MPVISTSPAPRPTNDDICDVPGIRVGHVTLNSPGWATGCTVVVLDPAAVAGVDVRGGGPGTRETDLLDPRNVVDRVDALVLSGGSAFGLRTADGVMDAVYGSGRGWPIDPAVPEHRVPIIPAAILFDLGRGEGWLNHPTAKDGSAAYAAAWTTAGVGPVEQGLVGAGTGARIAGGSAPGGLGSASLQLPDGTRVGAIVAVNAVGAPTAWLRQAFAIPKVAMPEQPSASAGQATTIGVLATDATLTKAECAKVAGLAHDGLARAIAPVHTAYDGDTFFAVATGQRPAPQRLGVVALHQAAADVVTRAIANALLARRP
ncbi:MAG: P1 family peptidase [Nostocoides sp.]